MTWRVPAVHALGALCTLVVIVTGALAAQPKPALAPFTLEVAQHADAHRGKQYQLDFEPEQLDRVGADVAARWAVPRLAPLLLRAFANPAGRFVSAGAEFADRKLAVEVYVPATAVDAVLPQLATFWPEHDASEPLVRVVFNSGLDEPAGPAKPVLRWTVEVLGERPLPPAAPARAHAPVDNRERVVAVKLVGAGWAVAPAGREPKVSAWLRAAWTGRRDARNPRLSCTTYWPRTMSCFGNRVAAALGALCERPAYFIATSFGCRSQFRWRATMLATY